MENTIADNVIRVYKDLDMTMAIHPIKKDVNKLVGEYAIVNSVKNLLLTSHYERPFQPELGSNIRRILFEPLDAISAQALTTEIQNTISNFEPRVLVLSCQASPNFNEDGFNVKFTFRLINSIKPITIDFFLERIR